MCTRTRSSRILRLTGADASSVSQRTHSTGVAPQALVTMARICCQSKRVAVGQSIAIAMFPPAALDSLRRLPKNQIRSMNESCERVSTSSVDDTAFISQYYHDLTRRSLLVMLGGVRSDIDGGGGAVVGAKHAQVAFYLVRRAGRLGQIIG